MQLVLDELNKLDFSQPLSVKNIRRQIRINNKYVNKFCILKVLHKSDLYRNVKPYEVGSGKDKVNVWTRV